MPLPPHVAASDFAKACAELGAIVGKDALITADDELEPFHDPYSPGLDDRFAPAGVVSPAGVDQVKAVLAVARRYRLPLWTVSLGRNYAYGGAAPCLTGAMILDLQRMGGIEVDEELAYATVEPGVTYLDLYKFIQAHGYKLWTDCTDPGWGSVIGNALDHGIGYTPYGDHAGHLCGLEVVLASGDVLRTGMGAMADNAAWPLYPYGFGPTLDGLFTQSNFGVVTKAGIWLMPEPEMLAVVEMNFPREEDIVAIVDTLRPLRLDGIVSTASIANWMRLAAGNTTRGEWYDGKGPMPQSAIDKLIKGMGIGYWSMRFGLYGRRRIVEESFKIVRKAFSRIKGADIMRETYQRGQPIAPEHKTLAGIPSVDFMPLNWLGGAGAHIECPLVVPMQGGKALELYRRRTELFNQYGFDNYCGLTSTRPRCFINTGSIIFDKNDAEQCAKARALGRALIEDARKNGLGGYRGHISEMDLIARQFDFNDHAAMRFFERLKDACDPDGILSPGKQGIWPAAMRGPEQEGSETK